MTILLAVVPQASWNAAASGGLSCSKDLLITTGCPINITPGIGDGGVNIGGTVTDRGASGTGGSSRGERAVGGNGSGGNGASGARATDEVVPPRGVVLQRDGYTVTLPTDGRGPVTLADLVNFRPEVGVHRMEPGGWMVTGLDTNFYVDTGAHVQDGLLLDLPASVRFTPVSYRWDYGDGTTATRGTGGGSWRSLGLQEFSSTATSHVYRAAGSYRIGVTVDFTAEYTFGGSTWTAIEGTVPVPSAELTAVASAADTVLVGRDCTIDPRGPGC